MNTQLHSRFFSSLLGSLAVFPVQTLCEPKFHQPNYQSTYLPHHLNIASRDSQFFTLRREFLWHYLLFDSNIEYKAMGNMAEEWKKVFFFWPKNIRYFPFFCSTWNSSIQSLSNFLSNVHSSSHTHANSNEEEIWSNLFKKFTFDDLFCTFLASVCLSFCDTFPPKRQPSVSMR